MSFEVHIEAPAPITESMLRKIVAVELEAIDAPQGAWNAAMNALGDEG